MSKQVKQEGIETRNVEFVVFEKKCVNLNEEFNCPDCKTLLFPVCINLGMVRGDRFYCGHDFPSDCAAYGCPKYSYVAWKELQRWRRTGRLLPKGE